MKVDRLYTLSQFVDLLGYECKKSEDAFKLVMFYNEFLKQTLKKEMFVNQFRETDFMSEDGFDSINAKIAFEEYENDIIFDGFYSIETGIVTNYLYDISFGKDGTISLYDIVNKKSYIITTLEDLAIATKGELKLKNVEL